MVSRRIQLGPVMEAYRDQIPAFISLFRALFGDFDIDEIMDNSSGYLNTLLFLGCASPERSTHRPRPLVRHGYGLQAVRVASTCDRGLLLKR